MGTAANALSWPNVLLERVAELTSRAVPLQAHPLFTIAGTLLLCTFLAAVFYRLRLTRSGQE